MRHTYFHLHLRSLSLSLSLRFFFLSLSSCLYFGRLCFTTFSSVCFIEGPHLAGLGAFLHVQSLSLIASLPSLSVPFYVQGCFFSLFFLPCRHAFIFPQLLIIKLFIIQASQAIDVPPLMERDMVSVIFA